jgi:RNA polymerase sigma-70 factor (ECF subfamily)
VPPTTRGRTDATAAGSPSEDFVALTARFRRELLAHCYRMLGSVDDAEDLVQETYLNAWRSYHTFEGRASLRTWLYRIATRACLKALQRNGRRPLPSGLYAPADDPRSPVGRERAEVGWLQPIPDAMFIAEPDDPAATVEARQTTRLALVAALQYLPPRQRAVLILRDVLDWRAAEVAELLDTTTAAVNSALQRARAQLADAAPAEQDIAEPSEPARRALLDRYATAVVNVDLTELTRLLTEDASWEMPPYGTWFTGRDMVVGFLATRLPLHHGIRLVPTRANAQPAFGMYLAGPDGVYHGRAIQVLTVTNAGVARVVAFHDPELFPRFGLPLTGEGGPERPAPIGGGPGGSARGGVATGVRPCEGG